MSALGSSCGGACSSLGSALSKRLMRFPTEGVFCSKMLGADGGGAFVKRGWGVCSCSYACPTRLVSKRIAFLISSLLSSLVSIVIFISFQGFCRELDLYTLCTKIVIYVRNSWKGMDFFQQGILGWYEKNKRDLPWRKTNDVYKILVSEMMLQQTQVDRVLPKYAAFLQKFPAANVLAKAQTSEVIVAWSGLGYNRRAIFLQKAAGVLSQRIPEDLQKLPGVGPYTARALECFAFGHDVSVVDTNVRRIFSRFFFKGKGSVEEIDRVVEKVVPKGKGVAWNNALMDFGSLVCVASGPLCGKCPLQKNCTAWKARTPKLYLRVAPPQKKFVGSRRFYRGQVLLLLAKTDHQVSELAILLKKSVKFTQGIVDELARDGLVAKENELISLPCVNMLK